MITNVYASLGKNGINVVKHTKSGKLKRSLVPVRKKGDNFYKYTSSLIDSYPKVFKEIMMDMHYGELPKGLGAVVKAVGRRVRPNGDVYTFTRSADRNGIEWVFAQIRRAGELICSKEKYFMDGLAVRQDKVTHFPRHQVRHDFFNI